MNILVIVAPQDFRDEELTEPVNALERAGHRVTLASRAPGPCRGVNGLEVEATLALASATAQAFDGVVFVGGPGARVFFEDPQAHRLAREFEADHKLVAAICIAPAILARAGVLRGRRATVFKSEQAALREGGAELQPADVVADGLLVTASGPRHAAAFGQRLVQRLARPAGATARAH